MNLETIKQYVGQHLMLITNLGTIAIAVTAIGINNRVNNGGVFTFRNPNNAIVQEFNGEIGKIAQNNKEKIDEKYKFVKEEGGAFKDNIGNITDSSSKLKNEFIEKMKKFDPKNSTLGGLSGDKGYSDIIGSGKAYKDIDAFMKVVDKVKNEEIEKTNAEIKVSDVKVDDKFEVKDNKIALKPQGK